MTTLKIKVSDKVLDKFLWLLSRFNKNEVQIINELSEFDINKKKVHSDYQKLVKGQTKLYSLEDIEKELDDIIAQYEA